MSGLELLEAVKAAYPDSIRFVLSGQTDRETALRSTSVAHQFLSKPCDFEVLTAAIERSANLRSMLESVELRALASKLRSIPSLPTHYFRLMDEVTSPDPSIARVAEIIEQDIGMTAKVLQMVNSSFFGIPRRVERTADAAALLGLDTLSALITVEHVFGKFDPQPVDGFSLGELHRHSLRTGAIARAIAASESLDRIAVGHALMAGVLHDAGTIVLVASLPGAFAAARALSAKTREPLWACETKLLKTNHAELGGYLLGLWGFPHSIIEAVVYHHRPAMDTSADLTVTDIVHAADRIEATISLGEAADHAVLEATHYERKGLARNLQRWCSLATEVFVSPSKVCEQEVA